ncbi:hypothetical protein [Gloeocapsa sp. PCC 7428]|uniref:hypothetical protein n=1 Tax=Gloeocapsa sp. PCC 7428 TaxID=1173026 RepID=UPI0002D438D6|nr:hypothetical protein [Gloeocapsa sp. PCC 7428]
MIADSQRRINDQVVSELRQKVREPLLAQGEEYEQAVAAKTTVDKYWESKDKRYQEYKHRQLQVDDTP